MILVTGATGNLGSNVVKQLKTLLNRDTFVVSSSNANGVSKLKTQGFDARLANFSDSNSLNAAFEGIDKLLLISTMDQNRFEQHKNVIDAAKARGVKHIYYTSLAIHNIETSGVRDLMISHFQTEEYIKSSGLAYTIIRNTMYAEALGQILGPNALHQDITLPGGSGKVPYVLIRELGEATANLIVQDGNENKIYQFTGSHLYSYVDLMDELSKLSAQNLYYHDISEQTYFKGLEQKGYDAFGIYLTAGTIADIKKHQYEIVDKKVEELLGRPSTNAAVFLSEIFLKNNVKQVV